MKSINDIEESPIGLITIVLLIAIVLCFIVFNWGAAYQEKLMERESIKNNVGEYYIDNTNFNKQFRWKTNSIK